MNLTKHLSHPTARTRLAQQMQRKELIDRAERLARRQLFSPPPPDNSSRIVGLIMLGMIVFYGVAAWIVLF
jgi:hypothetical protein